MRYRLPGNAVSNIGSLSPYLVSFFATDIARIQQRVRIFSQHVNSVSVTSVEREIFVVCVLGNKNKIYELK